MLSAGLQHPEVVVDVELVDAGHVVAVVSVDGGAVVSVVGGNVVVIGGRVTGG